jgi:hypothetical protein
MAAVDWLLGRCSIRRTCRRWRGRKLFGHLAESAKTKPPAYWSADDMQAHRLRTAAHLALTLPEFQLA